MGDRFDSGRAMNIIHEISRVSEFIDPATTIPRSAEGVERYLSLAHRRLDVIVSRFADLGYEAAIQAFVFRGQTALNAVFSRESDADQTLLFVGHHDYCAGVGAEDDATALAVMLELANCLGDQHSMAQLDEPPHAVQLPVEPADGVPISRSRAGVLGRRPATARRGAPRAARR
jgi:hypothetical protein